ncbi:Helix-turn-helix domain protein (modular protein) [Candidatus Sulfopaludibacter sp. SbA4]|nr:Helix-turn-helix domain protein (modular protein) [Candidatus Sulfopaludibacter sp. SbA4]
MARISDLHKKWMEESKYRNAYAALEREFVLASAAMDVRSRAGLTQEALARKMGTTQPVVARLESGRGHPSMRTLDRLAKATGSRLIIGFAPIALAATHLLTAQRVQPFRGRCWGRYAVGKPLAATSTQLRAA